MLLRGRRLRRGRRWRRGRGGRRGRRWHRWRSRGLAAQRANRAGQKHTKGDGEGTLALHRASVARPARSVQGRNRYSFEEYRSSQLTEPKALRQYPAASAVRERPGTDGLRTPEIREGALACLAPCPPGSSSCLRWSYHRSRLVKAHWKVASLPARAATPLAA